MRFSSSHLRLGAALAVLAAAASVAGALAAGTSRPSRRVRAAATTPAPTSYVALGDSLAAGLQPDSKGVDRPTPGGYVDLVADALARKHRGLRTENLSCGGATTTTLLNGGAGCQPDGEPGQLVRAERFMAAHPGTVLVTVNIGDNDVEHCIDTSPPAIDTACVARGRAAVERNLPQIARRLRAAAGNAPVVGILDYDQFLALWLEGHRGRLVALRSLHIIDSLNALMVRIYHQAGLGVSDAGAPFLGHALKTMRTLPGVGRVPLAVKRICAWTWACSPPPIGHDDHPKAQGYRVIASVVLATIGRIQNAN